MASDSPIASRLIDCESNCADCYSEYTRVLIKGSILKLTSSEPPSYRLNASARTFVSNTAYTSLERLNYLQPRPVKLMSYAHIHTLGTSSTAMSTRVGLGWELVGMPGASQTTSIWLTLALERRGYRQKCLKDNHHDELCRIWIGIGMVEVLQAIFHSSAMLLFNSKPLVLFNLDADFVLLVVLIRVIFDLFFCFNYCDADSCLIRLEIEIGVGPPGGASIGFTDALNLAHPGLQWNAEVILKLPALFSNPMPLILFNGRVHPTLHPILT
ncbi:hypothetical protein C8R47DRAFT_1214152 [Mycena vitilis]|nr:hypothetical protein C8R47DRAFT_1214152 [Mycena vitilis]